MPAVKEQKVTIVLGLKDVLYNFSTLNIFHKAVHGIFKRAVSEERIKNVQRLRLAYYIIRGLKKFKNYQFRSFIMTSKFLSPLSTQDFEKKGLPVPKALVDHKPEAAFTVASLSYKAAMFYHRYGEKQKMLAAIERLPNKEDQITFLQKHGRVKEAAHLMVLDGKL